MNSKFKFNFEDETVANVVEQWWNNLSNGDKAKLRRCRNPMEVAFESVFHSLRWNIRDETENETYAKAFLGESIASAAIVLAHIKKDDGEADLGHSMGRSKPNSDRIRVSEARFRRLVELDEPVEVITGMRRIVDLLNGEAPVRDVFSKTAELAYGGRRSERAKRSLAYAYYAARDREVPLPKKSEDTAEKEREDA